MVKRVIGIYGKDNNIQKRSSKNRDIYVTATEIAANATDEVHMVKNPATLALGRLGGLKGGRVRAERLSPE